MTAEEFLKDIVGSLYFSLEETKALNSFLNQFALIKCQEMMNDFLLKNECLVTKDISEEIAISNRSFFEDEMKFTFPSIPPNLLTN